MEMEKKMSATPIIAVVIALIVIGGIIYVNQRPEGDLMVQKGEDMKGEGDAMMKEGEAMMEEGEGMMKEGEAMMTKDIVVTLGALNASGQGGKATFSDMHGKTKVVVEIPSGAAGVPQPSHIHMGSCPTPGAILYPLSAVVNGKAETILDVPWETIGSKLPLAVMVHKSKDEAKIFVSCGDLPKEGWGGAMMEGDAMMEGGKTQ